MNRVTIEFGKTKSVFNVPYPVARAISILLENIILTSNSKTKYSGIIFDEFVEQKGAENDN